MNDSITEVTPQDDRYVVVFEYSDFEGRLKDRIEVYMRDKPEAEKALDEISYALNDRAISLVVGNTVIPLAGLRRAYMSVRYAIK